MTVSDVKLAAREGFRIPEHLKRYTTLGMATDQGKTGNANGAAVLAEVTGRYVGAVGTTTFRPPFTPVAISAFAGHHRGQDFRPARLAPSHAWAEEQGAVFVETGPWLRALYYPKRGRGAARRGEPRGGECPQARSASATSRPSARSTCRGGTPASSSTASMPTPSRRCRSARRATG